MSTQIIIVVITLAAFVIFGFMMNRSINKYQKNKTTVKRKYASKAKK